MKHDPTSILVSVVLPLLDAPELVELSLISLRVQTFRRFEVLLVDSGDTETARGRSLEDAGLRMLRAPMGLANGWNTGLAHAIGRFVCFLEPGDELDPTYLEKCIFLLETVSLDFCAAWQKVSGEVRKTGPLSLEPLLAQDVCAPAAVIRKGRLSSRPPFDSTVPEPYQTGDLWIRLAKFHTPGHIIPEPLVESSGRTLTAPSQPEFLQKKYAHLLNGGYDGDFMDPDHDGTPALSRSLFAPAEQSRTPAILLAMPFLNMGGGEAIVSQLCRQLKALGFKVFVISTMPTRENLGDTSGWFAEHTAGIYHLPRFIEASLWPAFVYYLIQQHSINVLWLVGSSFTYDLLPTIKRLFPAIAVVDLLFNPVGHTASFLKYNYLIDHIVTEYEGMKTWLMERGEDGENISIIPNGVDLDIYRPEPRKDWRTGALRAEHPTFVAAFFGRLSEEKAPDLFVEIAARFKDRPHFEFLLCGTGPMEAQLRKLCDRHGLNGKVHFLGFVSTRQYLPCCDVLIVCSRLDGRPNIVMESMAMGIPIIASRVGGIADMAPPGQGSVLCEPEHVREFCDAIEQLATNRKEYLRLSAAARRRAETNFSLSGAGRDYAALFHELIKRRTPLLRPVRLEEISEATGLKLRPTPRMVPAGRISAWLHFVRCLVSLKHALGNLRTVMLYRKLLRNESAADDLRRYFDADYYVSKYPDAAASGAPLLWHYVVCGFWERHRPSLLFDPDYYLSTQHDVAAAGVNPLIHYLVCGRSEGRTCRSSVQARGSAAAGSK
jgi:O-antigen biosynthesis protein